MPFLNLDNNNTVKKLKRNFKLETGLNLVVFDGFTRADKDATILELYKKHREYYERDWREISPEQLVLFNFSDSIHDVERLFMKHSKLSVAVVDGNNKIINGSIHLSDAIPCDFPLPKKDPGKLARVNARIAQMKKDVHQQWELMTPGLNARVNNRRDWLQDYEVELRIDYILDRKDPLYNRNDDNIMMTQENPLWDDVFECLSDDNTRYYEFHDLFRPKELWVTDLQRIGDIWIDIKVWHQHFYRQTSRSKSGV